MDGQKTDIAIIGGGAAGYFCAANLCRMLPGADIRILESAARPLAKVAVSGGGRCNLTNTFEDIGNLSEAYPRGYNLVKRLLGQFSPKDTAAWFTEAGVALVEMEGGCIFPASQDAMQIVRTLTRLARNAKLHTGTRVKNISISESGNYIISADTSQGAARFIATYVVVTTGGCGKGGYPHFLDSLGLEMVPPVPSLFSLEIRDDGLNALQGLVCQGRVSISGANASASGAILITDWGLSGPAVLKASSYGAFHLAGHRYKGSLTVSWNGMSQTVAGTVVEELSDCNPRKKVISTPAEGIPARLWEHLAARSGLRDDITWAETGTRGRRRLAGAISADAYPLAGKCRFKDEFVTAGGISLSMVDIKTLECRSHKGLYFAGEILDIDGITGGFNLQAAWSGGYVAALAIARKVQDSQKNTILVE